MRRAAGHEFFEGTWRLSHWLGERAAPTSLATSVAIASWRPSAVDIFFRGADDTLMHWPAVTGSDGIGFPTHDPESHGGLLTSGPAAVVPHIGRRIDVIVRGADNGFWRKTIFSLTL